MIQEHKHEHVWRIARELAWDVYSVTNRSSFDKDHRMRDAVRRASFAIMASVAEGVERHGSFESVRYLGTARDEINDLRRQLDHAQEKGYVSSVVVAGLELALANLEKEIGEMITAVSHDCIGSNGAGANYQII